MTLPLQINIFSVIARAVVSISIAENSFKKCYIQRVNKVHQRVCDINKNFLTQNCNNPYQNKIALGSDMFFTVLMCSSTEIVP